MKDEVVGLIEKESELRHKHWYLFPLFGTLFLISFYKCAKTVWKLLRGKKINWREA